MNMGDLSIFWGFQFLSFFRNLNFLSYRFFTCLVRVTPRYFILFVTIVKGIVSLISFSAHLSLLQWKATDLFELVLYLATLLKLFISWRSSLVEFLGCLCILSYHLQIVIPLFLLCQFVSPWFLSVVLLVLANTSSTILNRYEESGHTCLVPDFSGIASSMSPFNLILAVGLQ